MFEKKFKIKIVDKRNEMKVATKEVVFDDEKEIFAFLNSLSPASATYYTDKGLIVIVKSPENLVAMNGEAMKSEV